MMEATDPLAQAILRFWFDDALASVDAARKRSKVWFNADPAFDAELARRFGDCPARAAAGELDAWASEPESAAARILVLDQLPRNLYRGTARAFAFDAAAAVAAEAAVAAGHDAKLHPLIAAFVYLPFEHAEDLRLQDVSVERYRALEQRAPAGLEALFKGFTDYAERHRVIIARFGRFPHRNAILGRASSAEELAYLENGGERFGVKPG